MPKTRPRSRKTLGGLTSCQWSLGNQWPTRSYRDGSKTCRMPLGLPPLIEVYERRPEEKSLRIPGSQHEKSQESPLSREERPRRSIVKEIVRSINRVKRAGPERSQRGYTQKSRSAGTKGLPGTGEYHVTASLRKRSLYASTSPQEGALASPRDDESIFAIGRKSVGLQYGVPAMKESSMPSNLHPV